MKKKNKIYIEATDFYESGDIDKALQKCEQGISENMKNASILNLKGLLLYLKGDLKGAVTVWKINADFNDDGVSKNYIKDSKEDEKRIILYKNAEKLVREMHIDMAISNLQKCLESDFNSINVNTLLASCYIKKGDFDLASVHITKALETDRNNQFAIKVAKNLEEFAGIKLTTLNNKNYAKPILFIIVISLLIGTGGFVYKYYIANNDDSSDVASTSIEEVPFKQETQDKKDTKEQPKKENENEKKGQNTTEKVNLDGISDAINNKDYITLVDKVNSIKDVQLTGEQKTICYKAKQLLNSEGIESIYNTALNLYQNKKNDEAIKYFNKIANYDKNNVFYSSSLFYLGLCNESLGNIKDTINYYEMYLKDYKNENYAPGVAYSLMLIYKDVDIDKSISYARMIVNEYSTSIYNNDEVYALLNNK